MKAPQPISPEEHTELLLKQSHMMLKAFANFRITGPGWSGNAKDGHAYNPSDDTFEQEPSGDQQ